MSAHHPYAAADLWDLVADGYAEFAPTIMRPFASHALEVAGPAADARIVDVAAGSGVLTLRAAGQVASVHAVDISERMLARLRAAVRTADLDNVTVDRADGEALPFDTNTFDAAFSLFGLMFFRDRGAGFAELFRVLRPGGVAVVSSWAPIADSPLMMMMFEANAAADPDLQEPQPDFLSLENPEVFAGEMRAAGFAGVTIQRHTAAISFDNSEEFWETMVLGSASMQWLRRECGERLWAERSRTMRAYLDEVYRPHRPLTTTAFLGIGHKPRL
ncbi:class I SAM-dependent methyltransferase [Nocardia takedensis]|uniref:class I SAM-dependent methyltransferase n=1 Tax=Nocardia takedensis TaxID=259390 RepID=UPI00031EC38B|nr:methyltransferase domain-containing protein [Nocardia takedensis]